MIDLMAIKVASDTLMPYKINNIFSHNIPFKNFYDAWEELRLIQKEKNIDLLDSDQSLAFKRANEYEPTSLYIGVLNKEQSLKYFKEMNDFVLKIENDMSLIDSDKLKNIKVKQFLMLFQEEGFIDLYDDDLNIIKLKAIESNNYHTDPYEHIFVQLFGKTGWVFKKDNGDLLTMIIEQGDAVFIPKGLEHVVYAFEKRANLTLMMEKI